MKKGKYLDRDEMELAKSLETEEWISDLTKKDKAQFEKYARNSIMQHRAGQYILEDLPHKLNLGNVTDYLDKTK